MTEICAVRYLDPEKGRRLGIFGCTADKGHEGQHSCAFFDPHTDRPLVARWDAEA